MEKGNIQNTVAQLSWVKDSRNEWSADLPCGGFVIIRREKPSRYDARGCCGQAIDRAAAWMWIVDLKKGDQQTKTYADVIADGTSVKDAKKAAAALAA